MNCCLTLHLPKYCQPHHQKSAVLETKYFYRSSYTFITYAIPLLLSKHLLRNALGYALLLLRLTFYVTIP